MPLPPSSFAERLDGYFVLRGMATDPLEEALAKVCRTIAAAAAQRGDDPGSAVVSALGRAASISTDMAAGAAALRPYVMRYRLQEAYRQPTGEMTEAHWDEWYSFDAFPPIDYNEVLSLLSMLGRWEEAFQNDGELPGMRRIVEVEYAGAVSTAA